MRITGRDLELIRAVVIDHFERTDHEFRNSFVPELKRGAVSTDGNRPRVGIWVAEERGDLVALVRQPPVSAEMRYFGVVLDKKESGWVVVDEYEEVETLDLEE